MELKIGTLPDEKRKIVKRGGEPCGIQKLLAVINEALGKKLVVIIDVQDGRVYHVIDIKENVVPLGETMACDFEISKDELQYVEESLSSSYDFSGRKYGEVLVLEINPK